ncbi:MAG: hypothetical protein HOZ81_10900 [Streptomyces sp.]|nr:hypothetical protein [Streptomyces sp.]NUS24241.1 hypothetical protein [Streptomyces sp.]
MSADIAMSLGYAVVLLVFIFFVWRVCRDPRPKARDVIAAARHDVGPDKLRLLQDLDAYSAAIDGLYEQPHTAPDPVLAAGARRLWDAVREEQQRGAS